MQRKQERFFLQRTRKEAEVFAGRTPLGRTGAFHFWGWRQDAGVAGSGRVIGEAVPFLDLVRFAPGVTVH